MSFTKVMRDTVKRTGAMSSTPEVAGKSAKLRNKKKATSAKSTGLTVRVKKKLNTAKEALSGALDMVGGK